MASGSRSMSMSLCTLLRWALTTLPAAQAVLLKYPQATSIDTSADLLNGWNPKPTAAPSLYNDASIFEAELRARGDPPELLTNSLTCGYTSGLWYSPVTCGAGSSCTYYTTPYSAPNFGCCITSLTGSAGCGYVSTCVDYGASNNPNTYGEVLLDGGDFYW